jgi:crotonobetainyl-CoA:carnitine CoA-transferase CaiB-like acyl-CoA transferase
VTVLELATFYAAPYGSTMLADLGARVIKVEQPDGDPLRWLLPFPEAGGVKVLAGKESVAVDMHTDEGREIVYELARRSDIVLQSFRSGVAERLRIDSASLRAVCPDLSYHDGPGFGVGGPYGHRPAYAPTIGAGSGMARRNTGPDIPERPDLTIDEIMRVSARLVTSNAAVGQADGFAAVAVGAALALGLLARELRGEGQRSETSMLSTMAHILSEDMVEYEGRAPASTPDPELYGIGALYRLYQTAEGWIFVAVTTDREWVAFSSTLGLTEDLRGDDAALVSELSARFKARSASEWERTLTAADVACVEVAAGPVTATIMGDGGLGRELGLVTDVVHPTLGAHPRATALVEFSRSASLSDGTAPTIGQHTDQVLREIGYDDERIADLRARGIVGG